MIVKIFSLFLVVMAVLAMFGRLRIPGRGPKKRLDARCAKCGRPMIGKGECGCGGRT